MLRVKTGMGTYWCYGRSLCGLLTHSLKIKKKFGKGSGPEDVLTEEFYTCKGVTLRTQQLLTRETILKDISSSLTFAETHS